MPTPYSEGPILGSQPISVIVLMMSVISFPYASLAAPSGECVEVVKLYQSALKQFEVAQKSYLKSGCLESSDQAQCKGLEAATREMRSTVEMFALRANALKCRPDDASAQPADPCERFRSLAKRSEDKLKLLQAMYSDQRCYDREYAPPCKALSQQMSTPREVIKAARRDAAKAGCEQSPPSVKGL